jgi:hypothetical protein
MSFADAAGEVCSAITALPERAGKRIKKSPHSGGQKYFL